VSVTRAAFLAAILLLAACSSGGGSSRSKSADAGSAGGAGTTGGTALAPSGGGFFNSMFGSGAPASCPRVTKITEASLLTRFAPSGHDLTDVLFEAQIGDINGTCSLSDNTVKVEMTADFIASLGPADKEHKAAFSYFVAITDLNEKVLARQQFDTSIEFPGNKTRSGIREQLEQAIPLQKGQRGDDFHIYVGFVLSREEFAYNRAHPQ
jgi:hypothetical protein